MLINSPGDLQSTASTPEQQAFLQALLDDFTTFDDAEYPEGYDRKLEPDDDGYIEPVIRKEWNGGAAAAWGFGSREQIESALAA